MNIIKLKILTLIDKLHKVTEVSSVLRMKQPTVTFHMRSLEQEMNMPLFASHKGRVVLTEGGKAILPYAQQMVALEDEIRKTAADWAARHDEKIRVGADHYSEAYILPEILISYSNLNPEAVFEVSVHTVEMLEELLAKGDIELAVYQEGNPWKGPYIKKTVLKDRFLLAHGASHPLNKLKEASPEELNKHRFVYSRTCPLQLERMKLWSEQHDLPLSNTLGLNSLEAVMTAVRTGQAVAFLPESCVIRHEQGIFTAPIPGWKQSSCTIRTACHSERPRSEGSQDFWDYITAYSGFNA